MHRVLLLGSTLLVGPASNALAQDEPDYAAIYQIKQEAFEKSQLADTLFYLTDVHGPRLTGSPGYKAAAEWAIDHISTSDLMQAAAILASFVYHAANREEMLPRKPLPKPLVIQGPTGH